MQISVLTRVSVPITDAVIRGGTSSPSIKAEENFEIQGCMMQDSALV